jgi:hypothetical protein
MANFFEINHSRQQGKQMVGPIGFVIIAYFGSTNLTKMVMKHNKCKTLCFIFAKVENLYPRAYIFGYAS